MKLRVTIDTDECSFDSISENMGGVVDLDREGVAHWWYKSPSYFITFKDVEILECDHSVGFSKVREADDDPYDYVLECNNCGKPKEVEAR